MNPQNKPISHYRKRLKEIAKAHLDALAGEQSVKKRKKRRKKKHARPATCEAANFSRGRATPGHVDGRSPCN